MNNLTVKQINQLNNLNIYTAEMGFGNIIQGLIEALGGDTETHEGTPVNAVNATMTLTFSGVVVDGETISIGDDTYEFAADDAQTVEAGNIAVNLTSYMTASYGTLTVDTQPTSGDTMTIGGKEYTFVPDGTDTADGEISIGENLASAQANIVAAINGTDEVNIANEYVTAGEFADNASIVTALVAGTAGDIIGTTETFTAETNVFAAVVLGSGSDCTAANAITALVAAITASDTQGVGAVDGDGDTVVLTAEVAGAAANDIALSETLTNGSFTDDSVAMAGGVDGTVGTVADTYLDATYLYRCVADNTISGKNWRRISLSSVY